ncbi:fumarylacetoacetate hydrolase family protein [Streptomyces sp. NPDC048438]|uniref:fumarylacetoacetate hydrolase family protein n=1 Tax=Streptomyces sp. NPDC048438 TaxID=3365551 RepID=UPI003714EE04
MATAGSNTIESAAGEGEWRCDASEVQSVDALHLRPAAASWTTIAGVRPGAGGSARPRPVAEERVGRPPSRPSAHARVHGTRHAPHLVGHDAPPGEVIATGTPAGVGPLSHGDRVVLEIERVGRPEGRVDASRAVPYEQHPGRAHQVVPRTLQSPSKTGCLSGRTTSTTDGRSPRHAHRGRPTTSAICSGVPSRSTRPSGLPGDHFPKPKADRPGAPCMPPCGCRAPARAVVSPGPARAP